MYVFKYDGWSVALFDFDYVVMDTFGDIVVITSEFDLACKICRNHGIIV